MNNNEISIRNRDTQKQNTYKIDKAIELIMEEIDNKKLELGL